MSLALLIISLIIIAIGLIFDYARDKYIVSKLTKKIAQKEAELKLAVADKKNLKEELIVLQQQLGQTREDMVTHLLSWHLFEDRLNQNIKESERYHLTLAILFVDIDDFKVINDALSYEAGDLLLQEVGTRLQSSIRQVDSVSRFTKDTFALILTQLAKPETAAIVAQRILQSLSDPFQIKGRELHITACIGIALYPADGADSAALLRSADHALHLAKEKGKNVYQFYQERMFAKSQRELSLYNGLNRDSLLQEFVLYYQPVINVRSEEIVCMDALLHWKHPELGLINSQELFSLAEKQRKSNVIFEWLLRNACKQFLKWRELGFCPPLLGLPLLGKQLETSHFVHRISQILQELKFKPEWLLLQIKTCPAEVAMGSLEKSFNMLHYLGVKLAIDDFGAGTFPLYHLKKFSIHYLKLDPALIEDVSTNPQSVALVQAIISLANSMNLEVIVPGVETEAQLDILKNLNCLLMQGRLLGPPLFEAEMTAKMVSHLSN